MYGDGRHTPPDKAKVARSGPSEPANSARRGHPRTVPYAKMSSKGRIELQISLPIKPRKRDRRLKGKEGGWPVPGKGSPPRNGRRRPPGPRKTMIWSDFGARARFPKFCAYNKLQPEIRAPGGQKHRGPGEGEEAQRPSPTATHAPRSISRLGGAFGLFPSTSDNY